MQVSNLTSSSPTPTTQTHECHSSPAVTLPSVQDISPPVTVNECAFDGVPLVSSHRMLDSQGFLVRSCPRLPQDLSSRSSFTLAQRRVRRRLDFDAADSSMVLPSFRPILLPDEGTTPELTVTNSPSPEDPPRRFQEASPSHDAPLEEDFMATPDEIELCSSHSPTTSFIPILRVPPRPTWATTNCAAPRLPEQSISSQAGGLLMRSNPSKFRATFPNLCQE